MGCEDSKEAMGPYTPDLVRYTECEGNYSNFAAHDTQFPSEKQLRNVTYNQWNSLQISICKQGGRANFDFILNNGMKNEINEEDIDWNKKPCKFWTNMNEGRSVIRRVDYQWFTATGPTQLGWAIFYNSNGDCLCEIGEEEEGQEMKSIQIGEQERLIGYRAKISADDPYELHDISWMIAKVHSPVHEEHEITAAQMS